MNDKINKVSSLILDMDGVLWHGETPVPGLAQFFNEINRRQISFILATNNATKTPKQYASKLDRFGIGVSESQILTSAEATAGYVKHAFPTASSAYIIGEVGLHEAMRSRGYHILDDDVDDLSSVQADVVVASMTRYVCYQHLAIANHLINHGAAFVGTNPDVTFPSENGRMPGAGSILAFLETSSGVTPEVVGKPNSIMFQEAIHRLSSNVEDTVMVGDRMNTDIVGAHSVGLRTVLLLSGIATRDDIKSASIKPDWVYDDLRSFTADFGASFPILGSNR
jgi:4-nitrophenyl phosphatase